MIIFASIFGVGFLILAISALFGGDSDIDTDVDIDHDVGAGSGPSIFSVKMVSLLMVGFGAVGFGCRAASDMSMFHSSLAGVGGGVAVGIVGYLIIRAFYASQASSTIGNQDIVGQTANVIDAIDTDQNGQVACVVRGREITFLARSEDSSSIARGAQVTIVSKAGAIVTVRPID